MPTRRPGFGLLAWSDLLDLGFVPSPPRKPYPLWLTGEPVVLLLRPPANLIYACLEQITRAIVPPFDAISGLGGERPTHDHSELPGLLLERVGKARESVADGLIPNPGRRPPEFKSIGLLPARVVE